MAKSAMVMPGQWRYQRSVNAKELSMCALGCEIDRVGAKFVRYDELPLNDDDIMVLNKYY